jgi:DNA-binding Xre family transcriptional regulator
MIELQIKELMKAKGIKSPYKQLVRAGIGRSTVTQYMTGKRQSIGLEHIEIFCTMLRCTPNELFAWTPTQKADDYPENLLQAIRKKPLLDLEAKLKSMSVDELTRRLGD